jgi:hypothetical protein
MTDALPTCYLCDAALAPGDKAMFRDVPDKGIMRVHIMCAAKARISRLGKRPES